jgi:hypothetical protein
MLLFQQTFSDLSEGPVRIADVAFGGQSGCTPKE